MRLQEISLRDSIAYLNEISVMFLFHNDSNACEHASIAQNMVNSFGAVKVTLGSR